MYKNTLRVHGEYLAKAQAIPAAGSVAGNGGEQKAGSMMGAAEVVMAAASDVTIADGSTLSLSVEGSADGVSFAALPVSYSATFTGAASFSAGDIMARLPLASDTPASVRAVFSTDDAAASGFVDVFFEYLPR